MEKLEEIESEARKNHIPLLRERSSGFLSQFCAEKNFKDILEIGTAVGYSGILMLSNCKNAHLTTIEIDEKLYLIAKENFRIFNFENRVDLILGDAKNVLETIKQKFDLIFLDGPKGQYINYLPKLIKLIKKGGFLVADNVLFNGLVYSKEFIPHKHRTIVVNLRKFLEELQKDKRLETKIYEIEDGISVSELIQ